MHKHTHIRALSGFWGVPGEMEKGPQAHFITVASFPHIPAVHEQSDTSLFSAIQPPQSDCIISLGSL